MRVELAMLVVLTALGCDDGCKSQSFPGLEELDEISLSAVNDEAAGDRVQADGRLVIDGVVPRCLSSCSTSSVTNCQIAPQPDGTLGLRYDFEECSPTGSDQVCNAACRLESARCESAPLAPGEYTIKHRDESYTFTVGDGAEALDTAPFRQF